uniref:Gelsolin-like n=1 Tax=Gouania willdenowi TaxID=441366 RepID=A0A8C5DSK6_GOUWI
MAQVQDEFDKAGKQPGVQVWRIEDMGKLVPIPVEEYGNFYTGDTYIVLHTMERNHHIYLWKGAETSQDESGAGVILTIQMDDYLQRPAVQVMVCQGHEPSSFVSLFRQGPHGKNGIKFLKGGKESAFNDVETNLVDVQRLLHVKGRRSIRATEREFSWLSFNTGDSFIIDLGEKIYVWSGSESNAFERMKCTMIAKDIRDSERAGRGSVENILEGEEPEVVIELLGPKPDLPPGTSDKAADKRKIKDESGEMEIELVADKSPFDQDSLAQDNCFILDSGSDIHVWIGKEADTEERVAAIKRAQQFVSQKNCSKETSIYVQKGGSEDATFKQFFPDWLDKDETTDPTKPVNRGRIAQVEQIPFDAEALHDNKKMAAQHGMVDDGSGEIWRVEGDDKKLVDPSTYGQFFGGDCYLVLYTYTDDGRKKHIIYTWQGLNCSQDELAASAILTVYLDDSMNGAPTQVRVPQGKEPAHLVSLFKDRTLVIHLGGTSRDQAEDSPAGSTRLFHIRQSSTKVGRAVEVEPTATCLNTNDVFVLKTPESLFLWKGKGSNEEELEAAEYVANMLGGSLTDVEENQEPDEFWEALGGKKPYQTSRALRNIVIPPRLFGCSNKTGRLIAEEVAEVFQQLDLAPDDVMLLDTWDQVNHITSADYLSSDPAGRKDIPITIVKQGEEPLTFTGWFQAWNPDAWDNTFLDNIQRHKALKKKK